MPARQTVVKESKVLRAAPLSGETALQHFSSKDGGVTIEIYYVAT
jgi:hypothetical protein